MQDGLNTVRAYSVHSKRFGVTFTCTGWFYSLGSPTFVILFENFIVILLYTIRDLFLFCSLSIFLNIKASPNNSLHLFTVMCVIIIRAVNFVHCNSSGDLKWNITLIIQMHQPTASGVMGSSEIFLLEITDVKTDKIPMNSNPLFTE